MFTGACLQSHGVLSGRRINNAGFRHCSSFQPVCRTLNKVFTGMPIVFAAFMMIPCQMGDHSFGQQQQQPQQSSLSFGTKPFGAPTTTGGGGLTMGFGQQAAGTGFGATQPSLFGGGAQQQQAQQPNLFGGGTTLGTCSRSVAFHAETDRQSPLRGSTTD